MIGTTLDDGRVVKIAFRHRRHEGVAVRVGHDALAHASTACVLYHWERDVKDEDLVSLSVGTAFCSVSDQFNREVGRRIALDRAVTLALDVGLITPHDRGALLAAYYNRPRAAQASPKPSTTTK